MRFEPTPAETVDPSASGALAERWLEVPFTPMDNPVVAALGSRAQVALFRVNVRRNRGCSWGIMWPMLSTISGVFPRFGRRETKVVSRFAQVGALAADTNCVTSSAFVVRHRAATNNSPAPNGARRSGLLAATRRMTVYILAALPVCVVASSLALLVRAQNWSPMVLLGASVVVALLCVATAEVWRRLGQLSDLTALNEELRYRATHDLLMQIPNCELLRTEMTQSLEACGSQAGGVGLLFLDLDRFKFVNDSLGHSAGDELLKAVGLRIQRALRDENAVLARVGGDELVVLLRTLESADHLERVAERVLAKFVDPFVIDGVRLKISTSIGMAISVEGETADELYRHADAALYEAKERGRGRATMADVDLRRKRDARVRTELALREALADEQIAAWFQTEVPRSSARSVPPKP